MCSPLVRDPLTEPQFNRFIYSMPLIRRQNGQLEAIDLNTLPMDLKTSAFYEDASFPHVKQESSYWMVNADGTNEFTLSEQTTSRIKPDLINWNVALLNATVIPRVSEVKAA